MKNRDSTVIKDIRSENRRKACHSSKIRYSYVRGNSEKGVQFLPDFVNKNTLSMASIFFTRFSKLIFNTIN